jgi:hypothetical protein
MSTEKMNGLRDHPTILGRLKRLFTREYESKIRTREMILDIQDTLKYLLQIRRENQDNIYLETLISDSARIQSRLILNSSIFT